MHTLVMTVLVLATVALSSSNVVPMLSMNELNEEPLGYDYQHNDNTLGNKHDPKNNLNAILFNIDVEPEVDKLSEAYEMDTDNNDLNSISKNYNVEGFRKEQWHNYPRQLDRLNKYFYEHYNPDKRNLDPDDPGDAYTDDNADQIVKGVDDITSNEFQPEDDPETQKYHNEAEVAAAVINPLLIFRIHLACYNKDQEDRQSQLKTNEDNENRQESNNEDINLQELNPESSVTKVKREGNMNCKNDESAQNTPKNLMIKKRIFSLWSRLQSLNQKGHELHHRRHLYALYGLPDSEGGGGGGILTAETRATFMRPPGSPLRWG